MQPIAQANVADPSEFCTTETSGKRVPRVSVVVPTFNEKPHLLQQSIDSLKRQTFSDFECIVVDESSDPSLAEKCRRFCEDDPRFRYFHPQERLGLAGSLNFGVSVARTDLIARFDGDDVCMPDRLRVQAGFMDSHPEVGVLGGAIEVIDIEGRTTARRDYPLDHQSIAKNLQFTTPLAHPAVMMRRAVFEAFGPYNPEFRQAEDLDLWLRFLANRVHFGNLPHVVLRYRQPRARRHRVHWQFNLKARVRNFSSQMLLYRVFGIVGISIWSRIPTSIQSWIFDRLILNRNQPGRVS